MLFIITLFMHFIVVELPIVSSPQDPIEIAQEVKYTQVLNNPVVTHRKFLCERPPS